MTSKRRRPRERLREVVQAPPGQKESASGVDLAKEFTASAYSTNTNQGVSTEMKNTNTLPAHPDTVPAAALAGSRIAAVRRAPEEDAHRFEETWMVEFVPAYSHANRYFPSLEAAQAFAVEEIARARAAAAAAVQPLDDSGPVLGSWFSPLPVGPYVEAEEVPEGQCSIYGHCSKFCIIGHWEGKPAGMEVSEHGPWCESKGRGHASGYSPAGKRRQTEVSLAMAYRHGSYVGERKTVNPRDTEYVKLEIVEGDDSTTIFLPIGEAHRLAAGLIAVARAADRLDESLVADQ
jgi:hypothetical protein